MVDDAPRDMPQYSAADLRRFIRTSEHYRLGAWGAPVRAAASKVVQLMSPGALRIGQMRLSFDLVGAKLTELADAVLADSPCRYRDLLREDAIRGVLGPGGRYVVVEDGNHKLAALLALDGLSLLDPRFVAHRDSLSNADGSLVRVQISRDLSWLSEREFWVEMKSRLFLERLDGSIAAQPPLSFAGAEDDCFRLLAAQVRARAKASKQGVKLSGAEYPLWIKMPGAPDFIEFRVASVLRRTSHAIGAEREVAWRRALGRASIPQVWVVSERAHAKQLEKHLSKKLKLRA
jgi:hypothetical protein